MLRDDIFISSAIRCGVVTSIEYSCKIDFSFFNVFIPTCERREISNSRLLAVDAGSDSWESAS